MSALPLLSPLLLPRSPSPSCAPTAASVLPPSTSGSPRSPPAAASPKRARAIASLGDDRGSRDNHDETRLSIVLISRFRFPCTLQRAGTGTGSSAAELPLSSARDKSCALSLHSSFFHSQPHRHRSWSAATYRATKSRDHSRVIFFSSAPAEPILPSRPLDRSAVARSGGQGWRGAPPIGSSLMAASTMAPLSGTGRELNTAALGCLERTTIERRDPAHALYGSRSASVA